jgi:hypothetical protein
MPSSVLSSVPTAGAMLAARYSFAGAERVRWADGLPRIGSRLRAASAFPHAAVAFLRARLTFSRLWTRRAKYSLRAASARRRRSLSGRTPSGSTSRSNRARNALRAFCVASRESLLADFARPPRRPDQTACACFSSGERTNDGYSLLGVPTRRPFQTSVQILANATPTPNDRRLRLLCPAVRAGYRARVAKRLRTLRS